MHYFGNLNFKAFKKALKFEPSWFSEIVQNLEGKNLCTYMYFYTKIVESEFCGMIMVVDTIVRGKFFASR